MSEKQPLSEGQILTGPLFDEPMRVETIRTGSAEVWVVGLVGVQSERFRNVTLNSQYISDLSILDVKKSFNGDGRLLRLGIQAYALGIAYEFDPYFGLSISRVDLLQHHLEAVYDYLLKLARVRFLLADDAGAGKTIMAGLLIRELKLRGLADRTLIVCPAKLKRLAGQAQLVEDSGTEAKLSRLKDLLHQEGFFDRPEQRLLLFTEFRDTLDYLVARLTSWGFRVGVIHGGMKPGSRDEPGTRLHAEQQFREGAIQVLVATEAAGEGINLQCCHVLFNYDIPWNP